MTKKTDPGAVVRAEAGGNQVRGERLPDTTDRRNEPEHPLPWLSHLSPTEYEPVRRWLARESGWRVATLDRLYREARREAGLPASIGRFGSGRYGGAR